VAVLRLNPAQFRAEKQCGMVGQTGLCS